ncbi:hypothetical protein HPB50_021864 [Hyalomma asiaticum]|uniref:Uncharacterized protein n=1 Tax=Hyalomma asiaticum TaxID=266040 RepID=A0ACB7T4H5_HYAAI|nr:hypothetical protein HPB50_021864 [Hyalomma asiaticum]
MVKNDPEKNGESHDEVVPKSLHQEGGSAVRVECTHSAPGTPRKAVPPAGFGMASAENGVCRENNGTPFRFLGSPEAAAPELGTLKESSRGGRPRAAHIYEHGSMWVTWPGQMFDGGSCHFLSPRPPVHTRGFFQQQHATRRVARDVSAMAQDSRRPVISHSLSSASLFLFDRSSSYLSRKRSKRAGERSGNAADRRGGWEAANRTFLPVPAGGLSFLGRKDPEIESDVPLAPPTQLPRRRRRGAGIGGDGPCTFRAVFPRVQVSYRSSSRILRGKGVREYSRSPTTAQDEVQRRHSSEDDLSGAYLEKVRDALLRAKEVAAVHVNGGESSVSRTRPSKQTREARPPKPSSGENGDCLTLRRGRRPEGQLSPAAAAAAAACTARTAHRDRRQTDDAAADWRKAVPAAVQAAAETSLRRDRTITERP